VYARLKTIASRDSKRICRPKSTPGAKTARFFRAGKTPVVVKTQTISYSGGGEGQGINKKNARVRPAYQSNVAVGKGLIIIARVYRRRFASTRRKNVANRENIFFVRFERLGTVLPTKIIEYVVVFSVVGFYFNRPLFLATLPPATQ